MSVNLVSLYSQNPQLLTYDMQDGTLDGKVNGVDVSIFALQQSSSSTLNVFTAFLGVLASENSEKSEESVSTEKSTKSETSKKESFDDIMAEMEENVPDRTTTAEEKELVLEYIDRILASDADSETKSYWKTKKLQVENELIACQQIESQEEESVDDIMAEMEENIPDSTSTIEEKELALSYINRILLSDADEDLKLYWNNKSIVLKQEIAAIQKEEGVETSVEQESIDDIMEEWSADNDNPAGDTPLEQKSIALSYIERILLSDADEDTKEYWKDKAATIRQEMKEIQEEQDS